MNRLSKSMLDVLKKSFNKELDSNKDGFLDRVRLFSIWEVRMGIFCSFIEDESDHFIETRGLVCHIFELAEIKKNATSKKQENIIW